MPENTATSTSTAEIIPSPDQGEGDTTVTGGVSTTPTDPLISEPAVEVVSAPTAEIVSSEPSP